MPLQSGYGLPFTIVGRPLPQQAPFHGSSSYAPASPHYFDVLRIPVRRGRVFDERDDGLAPAVAVISETMARRYWRDGDPLNDRVLIGGGLMPQFAEEPARQIIGRVYDSSARTRTYAASQEPRPVKDGSCSPETAPPAAGDKSTRKQKPERTRNMKLK